MRQLFLKLGIMITLMIAILAATWFLPGTYPHDLGALVNKKEMLISKKSPRIIFIGGSSLLTLNSPDIEQELNYSVANMGLWGGLSAKRYLKEITPYLRRGDVVVITREYGTALDYKYMDFIQNNEVSKRFFFLMSPNRNIIEYAEKEKYFDIFKYIFQACQMKTRAFIENIITLNFSQFNKRGYTRYKREFNSNGDRLNPFIVMSPLQEEEKEYDPPDIEYLTFLNKFYHDVHPRGIKVLFYFSHIPGKVYRKNREYIEQLHEDIKKMFEFPIINTPKDFVYDKKYFADTIYHLNVEGEKMRTAKMIELLKKHIR